jgi:hypothetical protein
MERKKMMERKNSLFDTVVKQGIEMSRNGQFINAAKLMATSGIPSNTIQRVLNNPDRIRSTDRC